MRINSASGHGRNASEEALANILGQFLASILYALLLMSALGLHGYTVVVAYQLASPGFAQYAAAVVALVSFPIAEPVVAYYAWRASESMVNTYSVLVLLWLLLAVVAAFVATAGRRRKTR